MCLEVSEFVDVVFQCVCECVSEQLLVWSPCYFVNTVKVQQVETFRWSETFLQPQLKERDDLNNEFKFRPV